MPLIETIGAWTRLSRPPFHLVGIFPDYASAFVAWKREAQRTVDNAHMRYFIAHLHRLRDEAQAGSATEELGG